MVDITQINLLDVIPSSIRGDPKIQAAASAIDSELKAVTAAIPSTILIPRLDELPEAVVDVLAWQYHVDYYGPPNLSLTQKRNLIRTSIAAHRCKGTPYAVEMVIKDIYSDAWVEEWWKYGGDPYHFRVNASVDVNEQENYPVPILIKIIHSVKNVRSWLDKVQLYWVIRDHKVLFEQMVRLKSTSRFAARFWNKDVTKNYRWNGVCRFDGAIDFSLPGMQLEQNHKVKIYPVIRVRKAFAEVKQCWNGGFLFDGTRNFGNFNKQQWDGTYTFDGTIRWDYSNKLCTNAVKVKTIRNGVQEEITLL